MAAQEDGSVLPFPPAPTASTAGPTLQTSRHVRRIEPSRLAAGAPNILIVLLDDVGFGLADTFGGEIATPTLTRLAGEGVCYNRFHTTSICSPSRAALLTGRNHQRVGSGTIAERALDFDGYTGVIPKSAATVAEVLHDYGYVTSAFGKWHNSPATETTAMGPFERWPTGYGFDYFYGFLAGETSQYEPRLFENTTPVEPPKNEAYHLYEYNMMMIERYIGRSDRPLPPGRHVIVVDTRIARPGGPAGVSITLDGEPLFKVDVKRTAPAAFSASETFDVGVDLGSPVSLDYFDQSPFRFDGKIGVVEVALT